MTTGGRFPDTRWSAVAAACSGDGAERERALATLAELYWRPVYGHLRLRWKKPREDAEDLTQLFFARLIETAMLAEFDPTKARLRTFLRVCLDRMVQNADRDQWRAKRGGGIRHVPIDGDAAELGLQAPGSVDELFDRELVRSLFAHAVGDLRRACEASGKAQHFAIFARYELAGDDGPRPTYADLAAELGIARTDVTNRLAWARKAFRRATMERLRAMTATDDEFRLEARSLLGIEPEPG